MKSISETKHALQRGATLTGYALTLATFAAAGLTAMTSLEQSSGEFLTDTGNHIGEVRPDMYELETTILASPDFTMPAPTDPPATDPPATDPPATDPPATDPPATDPPATDPPVSDPTLGPTGDLIAEGALQPVSANMCLVVGADNVVRQQSCDPATAPQFQVHERPDGYVTLSLADGTCLGATGGPSANAQAVTNQSCTEANNQLWTYIPSYTYPDGTQTYNLLNLENQRCLDVSGGSTSAGAQMITWANPQGTCKTSSSPNNHQFTIYAPPATPPAPVADLTASASEATLSGSMTLSNGRVGTNDNNASRNDNGADAAPGSATFTLTVGEAGNYKIKGTNLQGPDGDSDSFWVLVDGGPNADGYRWFMNGGDDFVNNDPNGDVTVYLTPGTHTVTLAVREDGARAGGIELVKV